LSPGSIATFASRLLFVGQCFRRKGLRYLVEAFTALAALGDVELSCVGTGASSDARSGGRSCPQSESRVSVSRAWNRHELYEQLRQADLFVFPSLSEGFSCALIEAMAAELPVVATQVGAAVDLTAGRTQWHGRAVR